MPRDIENQVRSLIKECGLPLATATYVASPGDTTLKSRLLENVGLGQNLPGL
jgi:hypothetical protein